MNRVVTAAKGQKITLTKSSQTEPPSATGEVQRLCSFGLHLGPLTRQLLRGALRSLQPGSGGKAHADAAAKVGDLAARSWPGLVAAAQDPPYQEMGAFLRGRGLRGKPAAAGTIHPPPPTPRTGSWQGAPTHLPRPSPDSCCAFAAAQDKINSPLEALADCSGGAGRELEGAAREVVNP